MATAWLSEPAEDEFNRFAPTDQQDVSEAISLLEDNVYRERNKLDLNLIEEGFRLYSLVVGGVWLGFHDHTDGDICIDWVSLRSRFRP